VRHSIVLTDTVIEEGAILDHVILDKRVRVGAEAQVGWEDGVGQVHRRAPGLHGELTVVGKNTPIPARVRIGRDCTIAADLGEDAFAVGDVPSGTIVGTVGE